MPTPHAAGGLVVYPTKVDFGKVPVKSAYRYSLWVTMKRGMRYSRKFSVATSDEADVTFKTESTGLVYKVILTMAATTPRVVDVDIVFTTPHERLTVPLTAVIEPGRYAAVRRNSVTTKYGRKQHPSAGSAPLTSVSEAVDDEYSDFDETACDSIQQTTIKIVGPGRSGAVYDTVAKTWTAHIGDGAEDDDGWGPSRPLQLKMAAEVDLTDGEEGEPTLMVRPTDTHANDDEEEEEDWGSDDEGVGINRDNAQATYTPGRAAFTVPSTAWAPIEAECGMLTRMARRRRLVQVQVGNEDDVGGIMRREQADRARRLLGQGLTVE